MMSGICVSRLGRCYWAWNTRLCKAQEVGWIVWWMWNMRERIVHPVEKLVAMTRDVTLSARMINVLYYVGSQVSRYIFRINKQRPHPSRS